MKGVITTLKVMLKFSVVALYITLGWIVGLALIVRGVLSLFRRLIQLRRALAPNLRCSCGVEVPQYGVYSCGRCRSRTLGWVWRCNMCGAWAGHTECPACGLNVRNPMLGAP